MKTKSMLVGLWLVLGMAAHAVVTVENGVAEQTPGTKTVTIGYDVSSDFTNAVSISLRAFDGTTEVPLASLSGDVGSGVATGTGKSIVWNAGVDWNGRYAAGLKFWVLADDGQDATPSPVAGTVVVPSGTAIGTDPDFGAFSLSLSNSLYMDELETTRASWNQVYNWALTNGYDFLNEGSAFTNDHPVVAVSWFDCVKWCNARSEMEGLTPSYTVNGDTYKTGDEVPDWNPAANGYRLPTSEEWEYAARGGAETRYPFGNGISHAQANYYNFAEGGFHPDAEPWPYTLPSGTFAPNTYGLYEMAGNVWEWCWDEDPVDGSRYQRGGSFFDGAEYARCGSSFSQFPINSSFFSGFRAVRNAGVSVSGTAVAPVDARDYTLAVVSTVGSPAPSSGFHIYAWGSSATCSVAPVVVESNTVYVSKGWTGSGSIPASGTGTTTGFIPLSETSSSIVWRWIADNDQDDLPNEFELAYYGSITGAVASADTDGDGYTTAEEMWLGTDPTDGLSHLKLTVSATVNGTPLVSCSTTLGATYSIEYTDSLTPLDWKPLASFAGTGSIVGYEDIGAASNRYYRLKVESTIGTTFIWQPLADSDGDELPNDWELAYFASSEGAAASLDSDLDGYSNLAEYRLGSDPTNSASHLNFAVGATGSGTALISSSTAVGRIYIIEYTDSLNPVDWHLLGGFAGSGTIEQFEDSSSASHRYYRMRVEIPIGVEL